ncbi:MULTISPECIES: hypothetical protein [Photorhabdus]|uniref:Uncharacterized protein n=1 Tax=Photorhabdus kayaii TaxID=230088 RepID=A0ABX0B3H2_9GAMM|nr:MULTISPECIES: hypothetical protein [Photorhabdus]MCC8375931.1 hypothetical protein [Photorhabdus bodei]MCT8352518.1 hypothetical protein [Photorhabdus kayaii]MDB6366515.1 hypothetical protein [Photorhabdus bodei]NDL12232.1 hypothetical protein [Photorhabdus kayaii]NDL25758.1 hypothetical protein [Photorhabdus kayaii]
MSNSYTLWISRCIAAAREQIPGSIDNYVAGVSECSQQRSNLKDDGYINIKCCTTRNQHKQCKDCADHRFSFNLIKVIGNK